MKVLFVDTTTSDLVVAIVGDSVSNFTRANLGTKHSETLCECVAEAMSSCGLNFCDLDAYACAVGPGSFTGIRIGISTVKGYALAVEKPLIAVNCLEAIANSSLSKNGKCAVIDAGNGYYFADYESGVAPCLVSYDDERTKCAGRCVAAGDYLDGAVKIIRMKFENRQFDQLEPLYIRRSQAEEKWKN